MSRCSSLVALLGGLAALTACEDDTDRADQARDAAKSAGLSDEVGDFFALATRGTDATFRISYATVGTDGKALHVTVTQRPPDRRIDFLQANGTVDSTIVTNGKRYQCAKINEQWFCDELSDSADGAGDAFDPNVVQATVARLQQRADDYDFRIEDRRVANVDARCLVTALRQERTADQTLGASGTLCLAPDGAQIVVDTPNGKLEASEYTTDIPADAFTLPAEPIAEPAPSTST